MQEIKSKILNQVWVQYTNESACPRERERAMRSVRIAIDNAIQETKEEITELEFEQIPEIIRTHY